MEVDVLVGLEIDSLIREIEKPINGDHGKNLLHLDLLLSDRFLRQVFKLSFVKDVVISEISEETIHV